jgi:hypothetical protein
LFIKVEKKELSMGEIKSTLDLVMAKTSHLTLSDEEKKEQTLQDARRRLKGLVDKYSSQSIKFEQLKKELVTLEDPDGGIDDRWLLIESMAHLRVDRDNDALIHLLVEYFRIDTSPIESALNNYVIARHSAAEARMAEIREYLVQSNAISGSAVLPNLEGDSEWSGRQHSLQIEHAAILDKVKEDLVT